jgi:hypothetical protein
MNESYSKEKEIMGAIARHEAALLKLGVIAEALNDRITSTEQKVIRRVDEIIQLIKENE